MKNLSHSLPSLSWLLLGLGLVLVSLYTCALIFSPTGIHVTAGVVPCTPRPGPGPDKRATRRHSLDCGKLIAWEAARQPPAGPTPTRRPTLKIALTTHKRVLKHILAYERQKRITWDEPWSIETLKRDPVRFVFERHASLQAMGVRSGEAAEPVWKVTIDGDNSGVITPIAKAFQAAELYYVVGVYTGTVYERGAASGSPTPLGPNGPKPWEQGTTQPSRPTATPSGTRTPP